MVPVVASNRTGREDFPDSHISFYGSSFIADHTGDIVGECLYTGFDESDADGVDKGDAAKCEGEMVLHTFDLEGIRIQRAGWGLFRDRRPSLYRPLLSLDGKSPSS